MKFEAVVIGKGLIGTAATRYLSQAGLATAVIGPDEPANIQTHTGIFASHYDQGRITRQLSKNKIWSTLALQAIRQYPFLQEESGYPFHFKKGGLYVSNPEDDMAYLHKIASIAEQLSIPFETLTSLQAGKRFPFLAFTENFQAIYEPAPAGYINPRDLIRAQLCLAQRDGAAILPETAVAVRKNNQIYSVRTETGNAIETKNILIATGAYTNSFDLLPQQLDLKVKTETIVLAEVPEAEVVRLRQMPTVIYMVESPVIDSIYLLPPIRYPDGCVYIKMGCNTRVDQYLESKQAIQDWMIRGNSNLVFADMKEAMLKLLPNLTAISFHTKRCLVTYTPHGMPFIDQIEEGLFVAVGGNGSAAKSSDTIGKLGAQLITQAGWDSVFTRSSFKTVFV